MKIRELKQALYGLAICGAMTSCVALTPDKVDYTINKGIDLVVEGAVGSLECAIKDGWGLLSDKKPECAPKLTERMQDILGDIKTIHTDSSDQIGNSSQRLGNSQSLSSQVDREFLIKNKELIRKVYAGLYDDGSFRVLGERNPLFDRQDELRSVLDDIESLVLKITGVKHKYTIEQVQHKDFISSIERLNLTLSRTLQNRIVSAKNIKQKALAEFRASKEPKIVRYQVQDCLDGALGPGGRIYCGVWGMKNKEKWHPLYENYLDKQNEYEQLVKLFEDIKFSKHKKNLDFLRLEAIKHNNILLPIQMENKRYNNMAVNLCYRLLKNQERVHFVRVRREYRENYEALYRGRMDEWIKGRAVNIKEPASVSVHAPKQCLRSILELVGG